MVRLSQPLRLAARLGYELLSDGRATHKKKHTVVFLHGILGSLKNWKTPARKLISLFPHYQALLVDHRGHGTAESGLPPHTLEACAIDVQELLRSLNLKADVLCGHSFGGKIALEYVKQGLERQQDGWEVPRQTWVFDSLPTAVDRHRAIGENSVWDVIEKLGQVSLPQPSKEGLAKILIEEKKIPPAIAHWLMTSLRRVSAATAPVGATAAEAGRAAAAGVGGGGGGGGGEGYVWAFDLNVIRELFHAYTQACYYETLASPFLSVHHHRVDFIRAGKNEAWTEEVLARFQELHDKGRTNVGLVSEGVCVCVCIFLLCVCDLWGRRRSRWRRWRICIYFHIALKHAHTYTHSYTHYSTLSPTPATGSTSMTWMGSCGC